MGYIEPYSTLLDGVANRLRGATGPFKKDDQVKLWANLAMDELAPSEELQHELSRSVPIALVCDGGSSGVADNSDGTDEEQTVKVWFCSSAPTMEAAVTGDGDEYWGACALKHWVFSRLADRSWSVTGWETMRWRGTEPVAIPQTGRVMMVATLTTLRQQQL